MNSLYCHHQVQSGYSFILHPFHRHLFIITTTIALVKSLQYTIANFLSTIVKNEEIVVSVAMNFITTIVIDMFNINQYSFIRSKATSIAITKQKHYNFNVTLAWLISVFQILCYPYFNVALLGTFFVIELYLLLLLFIIKEL